MLREFFDRVHQRLTFDGAVAGEEECLKAWLADPECRPTLKAGMDGEHSAEWFAKEILRRFREVRAAIEKDDASRAAAWAYYAGMLSGLLEVKQDWEKPALSGKASIDGAIEGGNMSGLLTNATAYNRGATADTRIDTLRKAATQLELSEFVPDVVILNPADAEAIELTKDSQNRYIVGQPAGAPASALWSTPVHKTNAMPTGTFLVGELQRAAAFWTREDARVEFSNSDGDNFTKNMVTILAELRATVTVFLPAGLVTGSF